MPNEENKDETIEEEVGDFDPDATADLDELRKQNKTLQAQKTHWKKKANDKPVEKEVLKKEEGVKDVNEAIGVDTLIDLQSDGFSPKDIKDLASSANDMGVSIKSLKDNETFMAGFKAKKEEQKSIDSTPTPANRTIVHKNKTFKEIISDPESTKEDKQIAFENKMRSGSSGAK